MFLFLIKKALLALLYKIKYYNRADFDMFKVLVPDRMLIRSGKVTIGKGTRFRFDTLININKGDLHIGDDVFFGSNVSINCRGNISIGANSMIAESVKMFDHDHVIDQDGPCRDKFVTGNIKIGKNVWIGCGTIILKSVTIGDHSVISAGSVITKDVPKNSIIIQRRVTDNLRD